LSKDWCNGAKEQSYFYEAGHDFGQRIGLRQTISWNYAVEKAMEKTLVIVPVVRFHT
jgi:hypothetical protein